MTKILGWVLIIVTAISGVLAVAVIVIPIIAPLVNPDYKQPAIVKEWGGIVLGFYFGTFMTTFTELVRRSEAKSRQTEADTGS